MARERDPDSDPAGFLGKELRRARLAAGFSTQDALAAKLGFDRTVITKAESGTRPPTGDVLAAWCMVCGLDEELYRGLAKLARSADGPIPAWFEDWLDAEGEAQSLRIWSPILIPGLLQVAEYARALFLAEQDDTSDDVIDALVAARMERKRIFDRPDPPDTVVVLDEAVLHRQIGSPKIMHEALAQIAELAQRPYILVQVVPATKGEHAGLGGAFDIASSDGVPHILRMEGLEDQTIERRSVTRKAAVAFNRVRADALPRGQSLDLIMKVAEEEWNG
jgi:transcriptional regulator with XRE-family HTH domain